MTKINEPFTKSDSLLLIISGTISLKIRKKALSMKH